MAQSQADSPQRAHEIEPGRLYFAVLAHWPRLLVVAVVGGLLGLLVSFVLPASYRATAKLSAGIDYQRVEFLDENAERHIWFRIQNLILSDAALNGVGPQLADSGSELPADLRQHIRLTRIEAGWDLSVTDSDPDRAARLANAWAWSALDLLERSQANAFRAAELQGLFFEVSCRPQASGLWACDTAADDPSAVELGGELLQLIQASYGIPPVISFGQLQEASPPDDPITASRTSLVIAGTMLGILAGIGLTARWSRLGAGQRPHPDAGDHRVSNSARTLEGH